MADAPAPLPHPSEWLRQELASRGLTQTDLAYILGVQQQLANRLALGKYGISAALAKDLGLVFEVSPDYILRLQKESEIPAELARSRAANPEVAERARERLAKVKMEKTYPVREMAKRGWLSGEGDALDVQLSRFFGVADVDELPRLNYAAKKTNAGDPLTAAQEVWLLRVRRIAADMMAEGRFTVASGREAEAKLKKLLFAAEETRKVPRILSESGIRYVMVEAIPGSKIDGVCTWLDESSPVIGVSFKYDRIDNFWFVLRHELEHAIQGHGRDVDIVDVELEGERAGVGANVPEEERIANEAAANFCVPREAMDSFIARKQPFFAERDFIGFARTRQVHPGIVAGQLQYRTGRYDRFREYQVKVRSFIAPGASVDGWGDTYPLD